MSKAICFKEFGGPEVLRWMDVDVPEPGPGEVRIRHQAIGVNFIDVYQRTGLYKVPLPATAGKVRIDIHQRYPLKDAAQAHRDLEARRTTGSSILLPD